MTSQLQDAGKTHLQAPPGHVGLRAKLMAALAAALEAHNLSQVQAARMLGTDQPTLSKLFRGRTDGVSSDRLIGWLLILGRSVEIRVTPTELHQESSLQLLVAGQPSFTQAPARRSPAASDYGEEPIYLDHHATTPVDPRVADVVWHAMNSAFGNANSVEHVFGEAAAALVQRASSQVAELVGSHARQVRFTSGSTEAIRIAFSAVRRAHRDRRIKVALAPTEHRAVLSAIAAGHAEARWLRVDRHAQLQLDDLCAALAEGVDLLCLMAANNEVGTIYPLEEAAALAHAHGAQVLVDATQAAGHIDIHAQDWGLDYVVLSSHKVYGPKGVGALVSPQVATGQVELAWGAEGTPNSPGIAGFGVACSIAAAEGPQERTRLAHLRDRLQAHLQANVDGLVVNGDPTARLPHSLHVSVPGVQSDAVVAHLRHRVAISTGAACASGTQEPSHVLQAMRLSPELQDGALRISLGRFTTVDEIDRAATAIAAAISDVRSATTGDRHALRA